MTRPWKAAFLDLHRQVDEMFEELIYRPWAISGPSDWRPALDLYETPDSYWVVVDVPDVPPEELQLLVAETSLTIAGERKARPPDGVIANWCERGCGPFRRTVDLAQAIDPSTAEAEYQHGSCRIRLPKKQPTTEAGGLRVERSQCIIRVTIR